MVRRSVLDAVALGDLADLLVVLLVVHPLDDLHRLVRLHRVAHPAGQIVQLG